MINIDLYDAKNLQDLNSRVVWLKESKEYASYCFQLDCVNKLFVPILRLNRMLDIVREVYQVK